LELYFRLQSSTQAGEKLGIDGKAVRDRLRYLGIKLRSRGGNAPPVEHYNDMERVDAIRRELRAEIEIEKTDPVLDLVITPLRKLQILESYLELQSTKRAAKCLGIGHTTVHRHIVALGVTMPPIGYHGPDPVLKFNDAARIEEIIARLKAEISGSPPADNSVPSSHPRRP
jgi:hypothetical protein